MRQACECAWIDADNAWRRLVASRRSWSISAPSASQRFDRRSQGGILELTQAQLAQTSAQLAAASAKYDYLARLAALKYATGQPSVEISPRHKSIALTAALSLAFIRPPAPARKPPHHVLTLRQRSPSYPWRASNAAALCPHNGPHCRVPALSGSGRDGKVAGYVRTIHVDLGDRVREGRSARRDSKFPK